MTATKGFLVFLAIVFGFMTAVSAVVDRSLPWTCYSFGAFMLNLGLILM